MQRYKLLGRLNGCHTAWDYVELAYELILEQEKPKDSSALPQLEWPYVEHGGLTFAENMRDYPWESEHTDTPNQDEQLDLGEWMRWHRQALREHVEHLCEGNRDAFQVSEEETKTSD
jgi:hypothetical protein